MVRNQVSARISRLEYNTDNVGGQNEVAVQWNDHPRVACSRAWIDGLYSDDKAGTCGNAQATS